MKHTITVLIVISFVGTTFSGTPAWKEFESEIDTSVYYSKETYDSVFNQYSIKTLENLRVAPPRKHPFAKKEKLVFDLKWGIIRAGYGYIETIIDKPNNKIHVKGKAASNNFVSAFYRVRDCAKTVVDMDGMYTMHFEQHLRENDYVRDNWAIFDHNEDRYISNRKKDKQIYPMGKFSYDYLGLMYALRTTNMKVGDSIPLPCFVHGKDYSVTNVVVKKETIEVPAGEFECFKIRPLLVGKGRAFSEDDEMYLWVTADDRRLIVQAKSKIKIGSIHAKLRYYEQQ